MSTYFAPGCALGMDKRTLFDAIEAYLRRDIKDLEISLTCCKRTQRITPEDKVVAVCPGCYVNFLTKHGFDATTLYDLILADESFPYPDYQGLEVSIQDACPTRHDTAFQDNVRALLTRMNLTVIDPLYTRERTVCCGDNLCRTGTEEQIVEASKRRAAQMPRQGVVVYCVSCIKALHMGGRTPYYLPDLLFGLKTDTVAEANKAWHARIDAYKLGNDVVPTA